MAAALYHALSSWGRAVVDFLYPPACPLCWRRLAREDWILCFYCQAAMIARPDWECARCGGRGAGAAPEPGRPCRLCPPAGAAYKGVVSVTGYGAQAARCVHLFKYSRRRELGELMGRLMAEHLAGPLRRLEGRIDRVLPVPLHWTRRLTRGFNQSELLARRLAESGGLTYSPGLLKRTRATRRQARVPRERRASNVAGAFGLARGARVERQGILLVDDVVTSGHTINECAKVLREAGAREIWVASFARAGMGGNQDEE